MFVLLFFFLPSALAFDTLLSAAGEVRKDEPVPPLSFASPDWNVYHRSSTLFQNLSSILSSCPHARHLRVQVSTNDNVQHLPPYLQDEQSLHYIILSQRNAPWKRKVRVMFTFGEQGRDLISSEIALQAIKQGCEGREVLKDIEVIMVPVVNLSGRKLVEMGQRCEKKNGNEVEIDLNFDKAWNKSMIQTAERRGRFGKKVVHHVKREGKVGKHPFSEVESRALRAIVEKFRPVAYIGVRSGAEGVSMPYDCGDGLEEREKKRLMRFAKTVCNGCIVGERWNVTGGTKCGTGADFMYGEMGVGVVLTWHVYRGIAREGDCFRRWNPIANVSQVVNGWGERVWGFVHVIRDWVRVEGAEGVAMSEEGNQREGREGLLEWVMEKQNKEKLEQHNENPHNISAWTGLVVAIMLAIIGLHLLHRVVSQRERRSVKKA